jgi:hypothetical protein
VNTRVTRMKAPRGANENGTSRREEADTQPTFDIRAVP